MTSPHQNGVNFSSVIISHWLTFWVKSRVLRVGPRCKSTVCLKHVWSTGVKQTHSCKNGQMFNRETVFPLGLLTETCESGGFLDSTRTWSSALLPLVHCHENVAVLYFSPLTSHLDMQRWFRKKKKTQIPFWAFTVSNSTAPPTDDTSVLCSMFLSIVIKERKQIHD